MTLLHRLVSLFRWMTNRQHADAELHAELQSFLDMAAADAVRNGATPAEARRLAALQLGGMEPTKEQVRAVRPGVWLETCARDIRSGLRQVRRNPGFSALAIATLALGIGVNAAMFSAVDAVLIRPLPYQDADRLVMIWDDDSRTGGEAKFFSTPPEWLEWRRANTVFTDIAASQPADAVLSNLGEPEDLPARKVTGNFWSVLGVQPILGRVFTEDEDTNGVRVVVISYGLWQRRFGASREAVGRTITLNDTSYEVVGVMPPDFAFLPSRETDVWMPASMSPDMLSSWGWHDVHCVARLKPGVLLAQAGQAMAALSLRVSAGHVPQARPAVVTPLREELTGKTHVSLIVLSGAAGTVLLIACVNLAGLLIARGAGRTREVAVRAAIGAGRGRLITQFLIESTVLAGLGALAGLALAIPVMRFLETLVPSTMAAVRLTIDVRVLTVSALIAIAAAVLFGLLPAIRGSRVGLLEGLRSGNRGTAGAHSYRLQHALIIAETALAVALLTTGGLLVQTLMHLQRTDLGIRGERVLTFVTPLFRYREFDARVAFVNAELDRIRAIPGVVSAGAISRVPLTVNDQATFYRLPDQAFRDTVQQVALSRVVTRDYFTAIGARLREGRFFDISDQHGDAPSVIVNESFADRHFRGRSPVGTRVQFGNRGPNGYWYTIVGVVKEIRDRGVTEDLQPAIYRVHEQADQTGDQPSGFVVRTAVPPSSVVPDIRRAIWSLDHDQPIARVQTIDDIVARQLSVPSQSSVLLGAFALLALLLAAVGLYGVVSYTVAQRTNEIGVRMALGARANDILLSVGRRGLMLTLMGVGIGVVVAAIVARAMGTLFYDFQPDRLSAAAAASVTLVAVAAIASLIPARRASRIDPIIALQQE
jgi:putative ABC transport system permease protein